MGAVETPLTPLQKLIAAVNRFGPQAPEAYRVTPKIIDLASGIEAPAWAAAGIINLRALKSVLTFQDQASIDLVNNEVVLIYKDPVAYVTTNLTKVTDEVNGFADSLGLPVWQPTNTTILGVPLTTIALGVGGVLALYVVFTQKGRKR